MSNAKKQISALSVTFLQENATCLMHRLATGCSVLKICHSSGVARGVARVAKATPNGLCLFLK